MPLANTRNGSLVIEERQGGLSYVLYLNLKTSWDQDCWELVKRGDVAGTSFQFLVESAGEQWPSGTKISGHPVREIHRVKPLTELSPCTFPAYEHSQVTAKGGE